MNSTILIHVASRAETRLTHRQAAASGAGTPYCISCNGTVKLTHCKLRQPQISLVKLRLNTRWGGLDPCQPVNLTMPFECLDVSWKTPSRNRAKESIG